MNPELLHKAVDPETRHRLYLADFSSTHGFHENPNLSLGDADSGHLVMFGKLRPYGDVAVKPYETIGRAEHELEVIRHAQTLGFDTLEPLELSTLGRYVYLVTRYRPDLRHLGQLDWSTNIASRTLTKVITPTLHFAADFAGKIHASGMSHGDFQAKNIARTREGSPVLADVENGQIRLKGKELAHKGNMDLIRFMSSALRRGLLYDRSPNYRMQYLENEFIVPALEAEGVSERDVVEERKSQIAAKVSDVLRKQAIFDHPANNPRAHSTTKV